MRKNKFAKKALVLALTASTMVGSIPMSAKASVEEETVYVYACGIF
ncbi:MAG: hypothetical protein IJY09_00700 [Lachnospiraceae bacterium]|nr:hypothetical protein [Lachnospiraceae bacterium]